MIPKPDRAAAKEAFQKMTAKEKWNHILTYYKLPLFTVIVVLALLISSFVRYVTKKENVLTAAMINVACGEDFLHEITDSYLEETERSPSRYTLTVYQNLYISDDPSSENHQYAYASKMKILGAINARQLDAVLMNQDAYDLMSASGFLMNLETGLPDDAVLDPAVSQRLTQNTVILEDNSIEYSLGEVEDYHAETTQEVNAVDLSDLPLIQNAGFNEPIYFGIIANTAYPRESLRWLSYLNHAAFPPAAEH